MGSHDQQGQRNGIWHTFRQWIPAFYDRTVLILIVIFFTGMGVMTWHLTRLQSNLMETMALAHADLYPKPSRSFGLSTPEMWWSGCEARGLR